ncbi:MAG: TetR/AcrR family transcriptional regulator [Candidatus Eisenbacteria bacterium]
MTRHARKERGRMDILTAAARLLAQRGFHGMSMRDLAAASGMNLANLYNYFTSKDELLFALQTRAFETLIAASEAAVTGATDPEERLHAFILNHVRYVAEHSDVMRVLVEEAGELPPEHRRVVRRLKERYFEIGHVLVEGVLSGGNGATRRDRDAAAIERATYCVFGMLNWIYAWYQPRRHGSPLDVARTIHRTAMGGLVARLPDHATLSMSERRAERLRVPSPVALPRRGSW